MLNGRYISTIIIFLTLILSIIFLTCNNSARDVEPSTYAFIFQLGYMWSRSPIDQITIKESIIEEEKNLVSDYWPGLLSGCVCNNKTITRGFCDASLVTGLNPTCKHSYSIDMRKWEKWRNVSLYADRTKNTYLDLPLFEKNCPTSINTKNCGEADTLGNILCVKYNENCPINNIQVTEDIRNLADNFKFAKLDIDPKTNNPLYITYGHDTKSRLLIFTKISDQRPCSNPEYQHYASNTSVGVVDIYSDKFNCTKGVNTSYINENYRYIDSWDYAKLLETQPFANTTSYYNNLMGIDTNHRTSLWGMEYIGMKLDCRANLISKLSAKNTSANEYFYENFIRIKKNTDRFGALRDLNLIVAVIIFTFMFIWVLYNIAMKSLFWNRSYEGCFSAFAIIISALTVVITLLNFICISLLSGDYSAYEDLQGCLDNNSNILLDEFLTSAKSFEKWYVGSQIIAVIIIILVLLEMFVWCKFKGESIDQRNITLVEAEANSSQPKTAART